MSETKASAGLPFPTIFLALSGILGTIFSQIDFSSSRPPQPSTLIDNVPGNQNILARLWEDPFEAIERNQPVSNPEEESNFLKLALDSIGENQIEDVFIVFVRGGPYAEDREHRMRTRIALHYAMSDEDYAPVDSTHIGKWKIRHPVDPESEITLAYETLKFTDDPLSITGVSSGYSNGGKEPKGGILVLWLRESVCGNRPLAVISQIIRETESQIKSSLSDCAEFSVLGPASSDTLQSMYLETRINDGAFNSKPVEPKKPEHVQIEPGD
ncbi:MAG: hypothetical protein AAGB06_05310, partial [Verrucomicrobiota bacterium]